MTTRGALPLGALAALFGLVAGGGRARAAPPPPVVVEPMRVAYTAPPGCPGEAEFLAALRERAGQGAVAAPTVPARAVTVALDAAGDSYTARLSVADREGRVVERSLVAASCREAMEAIVVVAVVSLRAQAEADAAAGERSAAGAPAASALPAVPAGPPPDPAFVPAPVAPAPSRTSRDRAGQDPRAASGGAERSSGAVLVVPGAATGVGPGLVAGGGLRLELTWQTGALGLTTVTAGFAAFDSGRVDTAVADALFAQIVGRVEICPWALAHGHASRVGACAGFEAGQTRARAFPDDLRVIAGRDAVEPWAAPTAALRLSLAADALRVVLGPELRFPLLRRDFVIEPHRSVYEVWPVAPAFAAGLGVGW